MKGERATAVLLVTVSSLAAVDLAGRARQGGKLPFGAWSRASNEPIISPQGRTWESASTFNPAVVNHGDQAGLSWSTDLLHWTEATEIPVLPKRPGKFDSRVVEPGAPPVLTQDGLVLIYNGADR